MKRAARLLAVLSLAASVRAQTNPPSSTGAERPPRARADVKSVRALLQLANRQKEQNDALGALDSLRRARAMAPNSEEVLASYAEAALLARVPLSAVTVLDSLVRISPTVARYHYLQGRALLEIGDSAAAVASLMEAERLEPQQAPTLVALGMGLNRQELHAEAKSFLLRATSLDPDGADAVAALAEAEEGLGEREAAEAHVQRALARSGRHAGANRALGAIRLKQDRFAEARSALVNAEAADPDSPAVQELLCLAYARLNEPVKAQRHCELFRRKANEREERVKQVRRVTGFSAGELQP